MEPEDTPAQGGLAAAALAHDAQGLALLDAEADILHRAKCAARGLKVLLQMLDPEQLFLTHTCPSFPSQRKHRT